MIPEEIYTFLDYFENSSLEFLELELENAKITLKKSGAFYEPEVVLSAPQKVKREPQAMEILEEAPQPIKDYVEVTSPLVGIFYDAASPDAEIFAPVESKVFKGQVLALVESMKMFNEIVSPVDGIIREVLVSNEDVVEFGTPLFRIEEVDHV